MIKKLKSSIPYRFLTDNVLSTSTLKNSSVTFTGTVANAVLGAVFYILAARFLGPSGFGILSVAIMILTLTTDMGDLGTDTGLVNFVSRHFQNQRDIADKYLKLGLKVKTLVGIAVFLLGLFISGYVATGIFKKPELEGSVRIAFSGVISMLLFSFLIHALQAMQKFWSWSTIQVATNLLRLLIFVGAFYLGIKSIESTMFIYVLVPFLGFLAGLKIIGTGFLSVKGENSVSGNFFKYNKWVAAFAILSALGARMDTFISARLLDSGQVGIYSAANQLVKIVPQIVAAIGTVIGPKMAERTDFKSFIEYFKKTQVFVLVLAVLGILTIPLVLFLVPYVFGNEYISAGPVFVVLFLAMLIFLVSVPIHMAVFYYYSFPKLFAYISLGHLVLISGLGWVLIGSMGVRGAAATVLVGQVFDFIVPAVYIFKKLKESKK